MPTTIDYVKEARSFDSMSLVHELRDLARRALGRMFHPGEALFAFRLRRTPHGDLLEGTSIRYTAIALIGLAGEPETSQRTILGGDSMQDVCGHLLNRVAASDELGEVALTLWAARVLGHRDAELALERLRALRPLERSVPTVELAWCLTALVCPGSPVGDDALGDGVAARLMRSYNPRSGLFSHQAQGSKEAGLRAHVCCYADLVYPIQALSYYHVATHHEEALSQARRCAQRMCELQGSEGQWWWHYDIRTGGVVERYPVYAVHQDAMGPMALLALKAACGEDHQEAIDRSLRWLAHAPELEGTLISRQDGVIWRKVARREHLKLVRGLQAAASRVHQSVRIPGTDLLFPPGAVDYESRPYHMGWILHALKGES